MSVIIFFDFYEKHYIEDVEPFEIKKEKMPEISRFLGMIITMYYNDHVAPRRIKTQLAISATK